MSRYTLILDPVTAEFYIKIAAAAGVPVEQVLSDVLFKMAGQLSVEAIGGRYESD